MERAYGARDVAMGPAACGVTTPCRGTAIPCPRHFAHATPHTSPCYLIPKPSKAPQTASRAVLRMETVPARNRAHAHTQRHNTQTHLGRHVEAALQHAVPSCVRLMRPACRGTHVHALTTWSEQLPSRPFKQQPTRAMPAQMGRHCKQAWAVGIQMQQNTTEGNTPSFGSSQPARSRHQ